MYGRNVNGLGSRAPVNNNRTKEDFSQHRITAPDYTAPADGQVTRYFGSSSGGKFSEMRKEKSHYFLPIDLSREDSSYFHE